MVSDHADRCADGRTGRRPDAARGASRGAYLEVLPDTRRSHADKLVAGENFSDAPGKMAVLHYKVHFHTPGRYYVWARIGSTTTEDNGLHVGIDGTWPESGRRMQWTEKGRWAWGSKQRTEAKHTGEPYKLYLDVEKAGSHTILFSMREDGIEFDKWLMTTDRDYVPKGADVEPRVRAGTLPPAYPAVKAEPSSPPPTGPAQTMRATDFPLDGSAFYKDKERLAINPDKDMHAAVAAPFAFAEGKYDITLWAVGENDGASLFRLHVGDKLVGSYRCPASEEQFEHGPRYTCTWRGVACKPGDKITMQAVVGSDDGFEFSRGRWSRLEFRPVGKPAGK